MTAKQEDEEKEGCEDWDTHPYLMVVSQRDGRGDEWHTQYRTLDGAVRGAEAEAEHMEPFELKRCDITIYKRDETFADEPWAGYKEAWYDHDARRIVRRSDLVLRHEGELIQREYRDGTYD